MVSPVNPEMFTSIIGHCGRCMRSLALDVAITRPQQFLEGSSDG